MFELIMYGVCATVSLAIVLIVQKLSFAFKRFKMRPLISIPEILDNQPSVSVCIPARNETHAMTQCLERVISSKYPKLEIIVLDDNSIDDTSILIRSFAHAGVRFIEGLPLLDGWLGKNHALQGLLNEASGSYVFFMDVDTQIQPDTISQLVEYALQEGVSMVSVLPRRADGWRPSVLLGSLRYYWEIILHRRHAPAVASGAWMIKRDVLIDKLGGFEPFKNYVQPEASLAASLMGSGLYRFLIGSRELGISYEKKWLSQVETSFRLLFSLFGGNIVTNLVALVCLAALNSPTVIIIVSFLSGWSLISTIAAMLLGALVILYGLYLRETWDKAWWFGALLWPVVIAQELIVHIIGIYRNVSQTVTWKGRLITVMRQKRSLEHS